MVIEACPRPLDHTHQDRDVRRATPTTLSAVHPDLRGPQATAVAARCRPLVLRPRPPITRIKIGMYVELPQPRSAPYIPTVAGRRPPRWRRGAGRSSCPSMSETTVRST